MLLQAVANWQPTNMQLLQGKEMNMKTKEQKDEATLLEGANELSAIMFDFFKKSRQYQPFTFGIIGYATELFMRFLTEKVGNDYDEVSKNYSEYLRAVHDDVKRADVTDLKAN